jgi:hypothetical protein
VKLLNRAGLKWLAIITMIVDHMGIFLYRNGMDLQGYYIMRGIGRISFPIFAFLLVEGFIHTKDYKKYLARILAFAIISESAYDWFIHGNLISSGFGVMFNFAFSLIGLYFWRRSETEEFKNRILPGVLVILLAALAWMLDFEYSWKCVLMTILFYALRYNVGVRNVMVACVLLADSSAIGMFSVLALVPITFYNGKSGRFPKWLGYVFYPLHFVILVVIGGVVNG